MYFHYEGPVLTNEQDAVDLISTARYDHDASWVAVPADRLTDDFFQLRTGVAGAIAQKFTDYRMGLAVVGDVSARTTTGAAFRDYVRETNRGLAVWFVADLGELEQRIAAISGR